MEETADSATPVNVLLLRVAVDVRAVDCVGGVTVSDPAVAVLVVLVLRDVVLVLRDVVALPTVQPLTSWGLAQGCCAAGCGEVVVPPPQAQQAVSAVCPELMKFTKAPQNQRQPVP